MRPFLVTTSWDDGSIYDQKLADLLLKYNIPATFYIPVKNNERRVLSKQSIRSLSSKFEIGGHTYSHKTLTGLSLKKADEEIKNGKTYLEDLIGQQIYSFCYPKGKFNQNIKQCVGLAGFKFARTTKIFSSYIGDKLSGGTTIKADLRYGKIEFPWETIAINLFKLIKNKGGIYHLWGHSWEIEENNKWEGVERLLSFISKHSKPNERVNNFSVLNKLNKNKIKYYESK